MKKFTEQQERILLDDAADPIDRASALACMSHDGVERHQDLVVSLLDHDEPELRAQALVVLIAWNRVAYVPMALDWLARADDPVVRREMALVLGLRAQQVASDRRTIVGHLANRVRHDVDPDVAYWAYHGLTRLIEIPALTVDDEDFDRERDVDWAALAPYLDAPPAPAPKN